MGRKKKNIHMVDLDNIHQVQQWVKLGQGIMETWQKTQTARKDERTENCRLLEIGTILKLKSTNVQWEIISVDEQEQDEYDLVFAQVNRINMGRETYMDKEAPKVLKLRSKKSGYHKTHTKIPSIFFKYDIVHVPKTVQVLYGSRGTKHEDGVQSPEKG